jgi:hypothetical protein
MRKLLLASLALFALAYALWPLWSAFQLRAAVKARDFPAIERKVDWAVLRTNLKRTLSDLAQAPDDPQSPLLTQALKRGLGPILADKLVDFAVTPRTLAHLLAGRLLLRELVVEMTGEPRGEREEDADADPLAPRRIRWAFFESPTRFRIEVIDPNEPGKRIIAIVALKGAAWRLSDVFYEKSAALNASAWRPAARPLRPGEARDR